MEAEMVRVRVSRGGQEGAVAMERGGRVRELAETEDLEGATVRVARERVEVLLLRVQDAGVVAYAGGVGFGGHSFGVYFPGWGRGLGRRRERDVRVGQEEVKRVEGGCFFFFFFFFLRAEVRGDDHGHIGVRSWESLGCEGSTFAWRACMRRRTPYHVVEVEVNRSALIVLNPYVCM